MTIRLTNSMQPISPDEEDAIKTGHMNERQKAIVRGSLWTFYRTQIVLIGLLLLAFVVIGLIVNSGQVRASVAERACITLLPAMAAVLPAVQVIVYWRRIQVDLNSERVYMISGEVTRVQPANAAPFLMIEHLEFRITPRTSSLFESGARYRIYYAPATKVLLAAEPVEPHHGVL